MTSQYKIKGGHYSGANPIPNIQKFVESLDHKKKERNSKVDDQIKSKKTNSLDYANDNLILEAHKSRKTVTDPITGNEVEIEDTNLDSKELVNNPKLSVPNANINESMRVNTDSSEEYQKNQDKFASQEPNKHKITSSIPINDEKTNILFHPTPSVSYEPMYEALEKKTNIICFVILISIIYFGNIAGGVMYVLIPLSLSISSGVFLWMKDLVQKGRSCQWQSEIKRGQYATANLIPESAEWVNSFLGVMWELIDPEKFSSIADMLEDVMQASIPGVVENVRVASINQGSNPIRILSLRALPDSHVNEIKENIRQRNLKKRGPRELLDEEESGDYYNLECSFAYHARNSLDDTKAKTKNMHMQLVFYIGIKGLFGVPLPIFVELQGLVGTMRIRLQMSPDPPFLKSLTFTFMGLPKVQASCIPMIQTGINVLNLPLISNFVNKAIGAVASEYVAPKSMTLDLRKILQGDDIQKQVEALGILWIRIHKAIGLSKQDRRGSEGGGSDPYITISFSKYGKPMYSTRVIQDDLNPIWGESCAIIVTPDLIKVDEQLSMELWDSDRSTSDDLVGKIELSLREIIRHPGKMYSQISSLRGMDQDKSMSGNLHWEVGWFCKPEFRLTLRTDGKNNNLPDQFKNMKEFQDEKGTLENAEEEAVVHSSPDPLWPSGICSIVVHQIINLELQNIKGSEGKRKGREFEPAQKSGEIKGEEHKGLPSSYCTILINDELVYRTRTKVENSRPIFNAGTERFIRDWRSGIITITVRDQRMREHDPILGIISLKISEILQTSSQATRWYPLDGGIGYGRVRVSLLFRSIGIHLPPHQLGWDVGTFEITSDTLKATGYNSISKLKVRTGGSSGTISRLQCQKTEKEDEIFWDVSKAGGRQTFRLPVKHRYRSPVIFEFHIANKRGADAYAVIWINELEDDAVQDFNIPIWRTEKGMRLTQNYITEQSLKEVPDLQVEELGRLVLSGRFKAGIDYDHKQFVTDNDSWETQETWEACHFEGLRGINVTKELSDRRQQSNESTPTKDEDILLKADKNQKQKLSSIFGTDWTETFGLNAALHADKSDKKVSNTDFNEPTSHISDTTSNAFCDEDSFSTESCSSLGLYDASSSDQSDSETAHDENKTPKDTHSRNPFKQVKFYNENKDILHRKHRGLMQWKPMRNLEFVKDETKFLVRRTLRKTSLQGKQPSLETEA